MEVVFLSFSRLLFTKKLHLVKCFLCGTIICVTLFGALALEARESNTLVIAGTGDSQEILRKLAVQYALIHPNSNISVPDSIGSSGGIKALLSGKVDIARTARLFSSEEMTGYQQLLFAISPIVFAVNQSVQRVSSLTEAQIVKIYSDRIKNWQVVGGGNNKIYSLGREVGDSSLAVLEKKFPGFNTLPLPKQFYFTVQDMANAIKSHKHTIGFLPLSTAKNFQLRVLNIDNVSPSEKNTLSERYPYVSNLYLATKKNPSVKVKTFLNFLLSTKAKTIMKENGVYPFLEESKVEKLK